MSLAAPRPDGPLGLAGLGTPWVKGWVFVRRGKGGCSATWLCRLGPDLTSLNLSLLTCEGGWALFLSSPQWRAFQ